MLKETFSIMLDQEETQKDWETRMSRSLEIRPWSFEFRENTWRNSNKESIPFQDYRKHKAVIYCDNKGTKSPVQFKESI